MHPNGYSVGILWESVGFPVELYGYSVGICGDFLWGSMGILWEFTQKSCVNGMKMGIEIPFPRQPCQMGIFKREYSEL